jgi:hypothetical protein
MNEIWRSKTDRFYQKLIDFVKKPTDFVKKKQLNFLVYRTISSIFYVLELGIKEQLYQSRGATPELRCLVET